jgi:hypothetical protein
MELSELSKVKARKMLKEIYKIASHATMTGALRDGASSLAATYNNIRKNALKNGWINEDFIMELNEDTSMANIGCSAALLRVLLEDEPDEQELIMKAKNDNFTVKIEQNEDF